jgi:hypothetical protein
MLSHTHIEAPNLKDVRNKYLLNYEIKDIWNKMRARSYLHFIKSKANQKFTLQAGGGICI